MSHRLHRGTLVPIVAGLFAVLMVAFAVSGTALGTSGAGVTTRTEGAAQAGGVRGQEWWLTGLGVPQAWQTSRGTGVTVAVLSTGVSAQSADLAGDVVTGPDYSASGRAAGGPYWGVVGTAAASIIAGHGHGSGHNSGVMGIAPEAKILSVRVTLEYNDPLNASSAITKRLPQAIASGILYAVSRGAKVIDLPLDPGAFGLAGDGAAAGGSTAEQSAVRYALSKGVVLIAPGGDDGAGSGQVNYPAAYPGVLAVGAVSRDGQVASFSSRRSYVALNAPGVSLMAASMQPAGISGYQPGYSHISTTSVASAMVAGAAALIMSKYPQLTPAQVTAMLRQGKTGRASDVNVAAAVKAAGMLAASLKPAVPAVPAAAKPAKPVKPQPVVPPVQHSAAPPRRASSVASSVLRDIVFGLGALILLLLVGVLLVTKTRQRRSRAAAAAAAATETAAITPVARAAAALNGSPAAAARARTRGVHEHRRAGRGREEPDAEEVLTGLRNVARPGSAPANGWPAPASWVGSSDWQGSSLGEIAHSSLSQTPSGQSPLSPPMLRPLPKSATSALRGAARPPWEAAPEPDGGVTPLLPLPESSTPSADLPDGIRIPRDMPNAFGDADLTGPFAGRDVLTQASFDFAAAPVPGDYQASPEMPLEVAHGNPGESTDVFPVVPGLEEPPGTGKSEDETA